MLEKGRRSLTGEVVKACLDVLGHVGGFWVLLWCVLGEAAMKGPKGFFIVVTMVHLMLSFLGGKLEGKAWRATWGHECESMVGKWGEAGRLEHMQGVCWRAKQE